MQPKFREKWLLQTHIGENDGERDYQLWYEKKISIQKMLKYSSKALFAATIGASSIIATTLIDKAEAHGYLLTPRSRNFYANVAAVWDTSKATENDPWPESDPQSLNRGGTAAQCGIVGDRNYDHPKNALGGLLKPTIQECYDEGTIIDLKVLLTAHHDGHFEFYACPSAWGETPTEECFKAHPLEFVEDVMFGAPQDPNYPGRAYIPKQSTSGVGEFHYKYKLPTGLLGEYVLLQWYYITANTCTDVGYDEYAFPPGFGVSVGISQCPLPISGNGSEGPPERVSQYIPLHALCFLSP